MQYKCIHGMEEESPHSSWDWTIYPLMKISVIMHAPGQCAQGPCAPKLANKNWKKVAAGKCYICDTPKYFCKGFHLKDIHNT